MKRYRIKTEKEFIEEFGKNWKLEVSRTWNLEGKMDYLFGKVLDGKDTDFTAFERGSSIQVDSWAISRDMVVEIKQSKILSLNKGLLEELITQEGGCSGVACSECPLTIVTDRSFCVNNTTVLDASKSLLKMYNALTKDKGE